MRLRRGIDEVQTRFIQFGVQILIFIESVLDLLLSRRFLPRLLWVLAEIILLIYTDFCLDFSDVVNVSPRIGGGLAEVWRRFAEVCLFTQQTG